VLAGRPEAIIEAKAHSFVVICIVCPLQKISFVLAKAKNAKLPTRPEPIKDN
jgi:hypothetical protein